MKMLTIQAHVDGHWHDAAKIEFSDPNVGIRGAAKTVYEVDYIFDLVLANTEDWVIDRRALSINSPASLEDVYQDRWPSWLLDLMPQGVARERIAKDLSLPSNALELDMQLLLRAGGTPIGNLRIKEAWELETERLKGVWCPPLSDEDIANKSEIFLDVVDRYAHLASGSSGVQGEWPKALMTRSKMDGQWYPDPFVATEDGVEHIIVKLLKSNRDADRLILESEAPYLEIARMFGLNVKDPLRYRNGVLSIPRFDREIKGGSLHLHGQESLVSAKGISEFAHVSSHEEYLAIIQRVSDDPVQDTLEYVLRDILNLAMGNPDNHGRNSALSKFSDGGIRLSPLFDFPPMRLSEAGIARSTRWACLGGRDLDGDWSLVCEAAACDGLSADDLKGALVEKIDFFRDLPQVVRELGIAREVIDRAIDPQRALTPLAQLEAASCPKSGP